MSLSIKDLSQFAAGATSLEGFRARLADELISGDALQCAAALEMATDPSDENFDETEARRLAGAMCAIQEQVGDERLWQLATSLARWAPRTVDAIRSYLGEKRSREAFETFLQRRPWPQEARSAVAQLDDYDLDRLADALLENDFPEVIRLLVD